MPNARSGNALHAGQSDPRPRATIAFVANMVTSYRMSQFLFSGIAREAREEDIDLICIPGNAAHVVVGFHQHLNSISHLMSRAAVNGLVVWGSGILGSTSAENLGLLFERFKDFPIVNVGLLRDEVPNVIVDNRQGMYDAVLHLIERHQCRRIAFIRGPARHTEAEIRFQAYADALGAHGLPFDPDLIVSGDFRQVDGAAAIAELLDRRHVEFDALVAASDWMAFGADQELAARGLAVPGKIKLIGFDDLEDCQHLKVPLTTVHQPFFDLGRAAVKNLVALMQGREVPRITTLPSVLVVRESCGCADPLLRQTELVPPDKAEVFGAYDRDAVREKVSSEALRDLDRSPVDRETAASITGLLTDAFFDEMVDGKADFLAALGREADRVSTGDKLVFFHTVLSALRRIAFPFFAADRGKLSAAETLWQKSRILVSEFAFRASFTEKTRQIVRNQMIQDINLLLLTTLNLAEFMNLFAQELPRLGIRSCFLSLYEDPPDFHWSRLMLAYGEDARIDLDPAGVRFPTAEHAPPGFLPKHRRSILNIQPLYSGDEQLGFFLFEDRAQDLLMNELLRAQLSMAIRGALLFREKEKLLADLEQRARDLQKTSDDLTRSNAELDQFAYIASHDLQEPLRKISVFADRLKMDFEKVSPDEGRMFLNRIQMSCAHMKKLINDLLTYSKLSNLPLNFVRLDLTGTIRDILSDLDHRIEFEKATVNLEELPMIVAEPVNLRQLFHNLITNALKFHRSGVPPVVGIRGRLLSLEGKACVEITVEDNGIGIDARHFGRIFVLFQRLHGAKDYEGTGIGLAICKRVVDRHGGSIRVESTPEVGTKFIVTLPLAQPPTDEKG
jgi:DNA-binding LacI/PurR family transcriptional regulator/signal transduction histidine kinase